MVVADSPEKPIAITTSMLRIHQGESGASFSINGWAAALMICSLSNVLSIASFITCYSSGSLRNIWNGLSAVCLLQCRFFMHRDVVSLVAFVLILWLIQACVARVSFVLKVFGMNFNNLATDMPGFRVPGHVIADFELICHDSSPATILKTQELT
jgi:hypothetical protein